MLVEIINESGILFGFQYEVVKETRDYYFIRLGSGAITTEDKQDCKIVKETE